MELPNPDFLLDFSRINWIDYRSNGINQSEVVSAFGDSGNEWYTITDPQTHERYYYIIGFSSRARFLFVLLQEHENDFSRLVVDRIIVADHEPQIRKYYYEPKFQRH